MDYSLRDSGPYTYLLEWAESAASDEWEAVAQAVNTFSIEDPTPRNYGKQIHGAYRLTCVTAEQTIISQPFPANRYGDGQHAAVAGEIIRKECLRLRLQGDESAGWLYKRKLWGEACDSCTDWNTGEVVNAGCETCYGTGIDGGYWDPYEFSVSLTTHKVHNPSTGGKGMTDPVARGFQCLAFPLVAKGDIWVKAANDTRWRFQRIDYLAELGGPIILAGEVRQVPSDDVVYELARPA